MKMKMNERILVQEMYDQDEEENDISEENEDSKVLSVNTSEN